MNKLYPRVTKQTIPEVTKSVEQTIPEVTKQTIPEVTKSVEQTIPEVTKQTIPEATKQTIPEVTKSVEQNDQGKTNKELIIALENPLNQGLELKSIYQVNLTNPKKKF